MGLSFLCFSWELFVFFRISVRNLREVFFRNWWVMSAVLAVWEAEIGRIAYWVQGRQLVWKSRAEWTRGVDQAIGQLLCKYEGLSSNPSPTKKEAIQGFILPFHRNSRNVWKQLIKCLLAYILVSLHWIHRSH
jgi:hypothetical protein